MANGGRLPEDLDAEHVGDDLLRLAVKLSVDECRVVVGGDAVACGVVVVVLWW